jgi:hypothetical protein
VDVGWEGLGRLVTHVVREYRRHQGCDVGHGASRGYSHFLRKEIAKA